MNVGRVYKLDHSRFAVRIFSHIEKCTLVHQSLHIRLKKFKMMVDIASLNNVFNLTTRCNSKISLKFQSSYLGYLCLEKNGLFLVLNYASNRLKAQAILIENPIYWKITCKNSSKLIWRLES